MLFRAAHVDGHGSVSRRSQATATAPALAQTAANPVLIEVVRGDSIESVHRGAAAVVDARGHLVAGWGEVHQPIFPRSAVKPIQALPLIETGAAAHFNLSEQEIALACASHSGEARHVASVERWLRKIGLTPEDLECGQQTPMDEQAATQLLMVNQRPTALHNNCSGKHAGFLTTARRLDERTEGYIRPEHPVQQRVAAILAEMAEYDVLRSPCGVDGCGIPVRALPLAALARAMAQFVSLDPASPTRASACRRVFAAMVAHPWLVAGSGRFDTIAMQAGGGRFIVKMGAEGVHVAAISNSGLGLALKIDDGGRRAADVAMAALLEQFGALGADAIPLAEFFSAPVMNNRGERVGEVRPAAGWLHSA